MANTYTPNLSLGLPAALDRTWNVALNANASVLDALAPIGALAVTPRETPSASLAIRVAAGSFVAQDGTVQTYTGTTSHTLAPSTVLALYLDGTTGWALVVAAAFPGTPHVRLGLVVTGAATILSITDARLVSCVASGLVRPSLASATAGSSWTSNEQGMLQACYDAIKALMK